MIAVQYTIFMFNWMSEKERGLGPQIQVAHFAYATLALLHWQLLASEVGPHHVGKIVDLQL